MSAKRTDGHMEWPKWLLFIWEIIQCIFQVGTNTANPCAMINASADLLEHLKLDYHSELIKKAVNQTVNEDLIHTADMGKAQDLLLKKLI